MSMKNKISKILCSSSLLMISVNKVLSKETSAATSEVGEEDFNTEKKSKEKFEKPKEGGENNEGQKKGEGGNNEIGNQLSPYQGGPQQGPQQQGGPEHQQGPVHQQQQGGQQGGGNGEDYRALIANVEQMKTDQNSETITLAQFCSGQNKVDKK